MATTTVEFTNLLALDPSVLDTAWCAFLSNPRAWALVIPEDRHDEILKTGFDGWSSTTKLNTTRLAKLFRDNFGVTLVSSSFLIYRNAFLFGIDLAWGVEANQYDLDAQHSEAAFAVSDVIGGKRINVPGGAEVLGEEEADEDEEFGAILPWDSPSIPLPTSLAAAWQRAHTPMSMETRSYLLEDVPEVNEVPTRAPENNHRRDNKHGLDKVMRSWQTAFPACAQWCIFSIVRANFQKYDLYSAPIARALPRYIVPFFKFFKTGKCFKTMLFPVSCVSQKPLAFQKHSLSMLLIQPKTHAKTLSERSEKCATVQVLTGTDSVARATYLQRAL